MSTMDSHSTHSQFNRREPKAGPPSRASSEKNSMPDVLKMPPKKRSKTDDSNFLVRRPIATNSRIKQDEKLRRNMHLSFVTNALQQKLNGDSRTFDELVTQFNLFSTSTPLSNNKQKEVNSAEIRHWFVALSHVVSRLERTHAPLIDAIVNIPWMTLDTATVKAYTLFIGMLLSARPEYLSLVLAKIAAGFTAQSGTQVLDSNMQITPLTRRTVYERVHYLLQHLLSLIPTLPSTLQPLLVRHFPHKRQGQIAQTTYIRNLLHVSSYCPELSDKILATIVDRAIQIDVEIQIELEDLEEFASVEDNDVFDLELDPFDRVIGEDPALESESESSEDDDKDNFSDLSSDAGFLDDDEPTEARVNVLHIQDMIKKMDAILVLLFNHFQQVVNNFRGTGYSDTIFASPTELPPLPPLGLATPNDPGTPLGHGLYNSLESDPTPSPVPVFLKPTLSLPTSGTKTTVQNQFNTLLSIFDRTILRTFKSRYTQFLIFWYASIDPEFSDIFQGMLVERALMPGVHPVIMNSSDDSTRDESSADANIHLLTPEVTRAAAASYIGSFVSRAKFVDRDGARRVVGVLCEFLKAHLESVERAMRAGAFNYDVTSISTSGQHLVFYSVIQAVFLIFCFRWRDLTMDGVEEEDEFGSNSSRAGHPRRWMTSRLEKDIWLPELSVLKRAISSVLNPLKVCSSNVVTQFSRIAHSTSFLYCYTILDINNRTESAQASPSRNGAERNITSPRLFHGVADLNTFFPFDPCRLPKSNDFIQGIYREWESVKMQSNDDDDDDESGDGSDDEKSDEDEDKDDTTRDRTGPLLPIPCKSHLDEERLGNSLDAMSISPAMVLKSVVGRHG